MNKDRSILVKDLFTGKYTPSFIKDHSLFRSDTLYLNKIFPSIGLPNFSEKASINKCLVDVRKEFSYVYNLLTSLHSFVLAGKQTLETEAGKLQYLTAFSERENGGQNKLEEMCKWISIYDELAPAFNPQNKDVLASGIQVNDGLVQLQLIKNIENEKGKKIFGKGASLIGTYNKLRAANAELGAYLQDIEQTEVFKIFCRENVPNKPYTIVFSSDGQTGAWDLLTMSMRGIKSCQRWDGDYPRCLRGSILSKFVGIIYLTSGTPAESHPDFGSLGSKMIRRCVVRYVVDADTKKPCILVDKMYTEFDKEILVAFISALKSKTKLDVLYAPDLVNSVKIKRLYSPSEEIRSQLLKRDWSYQDTPIRSKEDLEVSSLLIKRDEAERYVSAFQTNLSLYISGIFDRIDEHSSNVEVINIVKNLHNNVSFTSISNNISRHIINSCTLPSSKDIHSPSEYYRKYLYNILINRVNLKNIGVDYITSLFIDNISIDFNAQIFYNFVFDLIIGFVKLEMKRLSN